MSEEAFAGITYEESDGPWFGPRWRAKSMLAWRTKVLGPPEAIPAIARILGHHATAVQHVRFIDYVHEDSTPFRYTIALTWTRSHGHARDAIYEQAREIVEATGWYPLPAGERIASMRAKRRAFAPFSPYIYKRPRIELGNSIVSIESAVEPDGGCALRLFTDCGSLLLDSGLPGSLEAADSDRLVLLTHAHLDHSGGLVSGECDGLRWTMSSGTARLLMLNTRIPWPRLGRRLFVLDPGSEVIVGGLRVRSFAVPHCPGSTGYVINGRDQTLVYTGDIALETARHQYAHELVELLARCSGRTTTLLLEATMAARGQGATTANAAKSLLCALSDYDDIVLVSDELDHLLYAYLDVFHTSKGDPATRNRIEYLAVPALRELFQVLHSSFISRREDSVDRFITGQYRNSMSAWAESRWLYWLDIDCELDSETNRKRIWLLTPEEISRFIDRGSTAVLQLGRSSGRFPSSLPGTPLEAVDGRAWSLHSGCETLRGAVEELSKCASVILFHDYPGRLRKTARSWGIDYQVISRSAIQLSLDGLSDRRLAKPQSSI